MARHHPSSVKFTGASAGASLVGVRSLNEGLVIRVEDEQMPDGRGGPIFGAFELLCAGRGQYAPQLAAFIGRRFASAQGFLDQLRQVPGAERATHLLNRGELVLSSPPAAGRMSG